MKKLIILFFLGIFLISGCADSTPDITDSRPDFTEMTSEERREYCPILCGSLGTHDPCANDCMAGVETENTERNFDLMNSEERMEVCIEYVCRGIGNTPLPQEDECFDRCVNQ
tara:strand:+ start:606 stop:944 length:339 start_codon:yes stop_codon:yes gene_type:complete